MAPGTTSEQFDPFAGPALLSQSPSTEPQREVWTASHLTPEASLAYDESVTLELRGPLDAGVLTAALAEVRSRHDALRAAFSDDGLSLLVLAPQPATLDVEDLSGVPKPQREARLAAALAEEVERQFDLSKGPLFLARLLKTAPLEHWLVLTGHHLVLDGWSSAVVLRELAVIYSARLQGRAHGLPPAPSFAAYARERTTAPAPEVEESSRYWDARLAGAGAPLELPLDRVRPPLRTFSSRRIDLSLAPQLVVALRKCCAKERASLFHGLLAGFFALLHRLSAAEDLVVAIPSAGQSRAPALGGLVGHCVNTLPIRAVLHGGLPFRELLLSVKEHVLAALEHQELTLGALLRRHPLARDPSRLPLAATMFNLDRAMTPTDLAFAGLETVLRTNPRHAENFELFLNASEVGAEVRLECQFNTALFDQATVGRWLESYQRLLAAAAGDSSQAIGSLLLLTAAEEAQIAAANATASEFPRGELAHQAFEAQAQRAGDRLAVRGTGQSLTYRALEESANRMARRLRAMGVARGDRVGLCTQRTPEMVVGLLGILKAGAAYVPLDPGYPRERVHFMAGDAQLKAMVTDGPSEAAQGPFSQPVVRIDQPLAEGAEPLAPSSQPDDPAYLIYTSGSSGKPKGVVVPHRAVVNFIASIVREPGVRADDVVLALTTLSFDIAVLEIYLPLSVGARVALATRDEAQDGAALARLIDREEVTVVQATPSTWRLLLAEGWKGRPGLKALCGGEGLPSELSARLLKVVDQLWNMYGPTETTVWSTCCRLLPGERVSIGRPIANTEIHVLDAFGNQQPLGVAGELVIGGEGVALGYWQRPDLTDEKFVADPWRPGRRMYRTGDLALWGADGRLYHLGRNDGQVKLRGHRIELQEIEAVLARNPAVGQVVVGVREVTAGDARLVAWWKRRGPGDDASLRAALSSELPDYMIPQRFVEVDAFPLTPNQKIDRKALALPAGGPASAAQEYVAPRTPTEVRVAALWSEALSVPRVSIHDDFFLLGGHSLLASQVLARLRRDHGVELPFRKIFEAPTVAGFAALVDGQTPAPDERELPLRRLEGEADRPSLLQERLLLLEEMDPAQRLVHNLPAAWRMSGTLDRGALEQSLQEIVRRHESLRTSFRREGTRFLADVREPLALPVPFVDLTGEPVDRREAALTARLDAEVGVPHEVDRAPLLRVLLARMEEREHVLFILPQNLVWDGWSFDLFLGELAKLYPAFAAGQPSPLAPLPASYSDYSSWQRRWLETPAAAKQADWWLRELSGASGTLELPTDFPRPERSGLVAGNEGLLLSREDAELLRQAALRGGATLFHFAFAAYAVVLQRLSGQSELLVGTPVRGRTRPELEGLIGPFLNTLALRVKIEPSMRFSGLVAQVREMTLDAFSNQELPLETLGKKAPVLRTFFSLQDARGRTPALGEVSLSQQHVPPPAAAGDLMLWMMETRRGLFAMLNFRADLFEPATAQAILATLRAVLAAAARTPDTLVGELPLLDAPGQKVELARAGEVSQRPVEALTHLLARLADEAPGAPAVSGAGGALTRGELQARASSWASAFRASGARRVCVLLPPGPERIAALVGALRAGCATALLEPEVPGALIARWTAGVRASAAACLPAAVAALPAGVTAILAETLPAPDGAPLAQLGPGEPVLLVPGSWSVEDAGAPSVVTASALDAALADGVARLGLAAQEVVAVSGSASLPETPFALLLALAAGACLRQLERGGERDPATAGSRLAGASVLLAPTDSIAALAPAVPAGLRAVGLGSVPGAALSAALSARGAQAYSAVGAPTAGLVSLLAPLDRDGRASPGGRLPHARVRIVDERGQPCPAGVPGRLYLGSPGPAPAGAIDDPLSPGAWLVPSAWRARMRGSGAIDLLLRADGGVASRGAWIDPKSLGPALETHPAVSRAEGGQRALRGQPRLVGWYVLKAGAAATETELRQHLRSRSAEEAMPHALVELDGPSSWTAPGGLPDPFAAASQPVPVPPTTPAEKLLAELWTEVLGPRAVSTTDNFFQVGGHSLLLFEVLARLEKRTGKRLPARTLLLNSLGQAARELGELTPVPAPPAAPAAPGEGGAGRGLLDRLRKLVKG